MTITLNYRTDSLINRLSNGVLKGTYTAATVTNALMTTTNSDAAGHAVIAAGVLTLTPGFIPKYIRACSVTSRIQREWFEGMNSTDSVLTVAAGTRTLSTSGWTITTATSGTAPVTFEPAVSIAITLATDTLCADNDTFVWEIRG